MGILLAIDTWSGDILACAILPAASSAMIRRRETPALDGGKRVMMTSRIVRRFRWRIFRWDRPVLTDSVQGAYQHGFCGCRASPSHGVGHLRTEIRVRNVWIMHQ